MSKVICEVCGTAFAETADQCPICGTAKADTARPVPGAESEGSGYAYVKGGRFSRSNVRKHNDGREELPRTPAEEKPKRVRKEADVEEAPKEEAPRRPRKQEGEEPRPERRRRRDEEEPENEQPSNIGLIVVVVVLLLAIISLCAYIAIRYIDLNNAKNSTGESTSSSTSGQVDVPCTGVSIPGAPEYTFNSLSDEVLIEVVCEPANTTDLLNWNYDSSIVKMIKSENGWIITPVGPGEAVITVTCGAFSATLTIHAELTEIPCTRVDILDVTEHTFNLITDELVLTVEREPATTSDELVWTYDETIVTVEQREDRWVIKPVGPGQTVVTVTCGECTDTVKISSLVDPNYDPTFTLAWSCADDITLTGYGTRWRIYNGSMDVSKIVFSSSDESIATVENGYVYIWKNGDARITAAYGNQVITMIVRARKVEPPEEGKPNCTIHTNYGTQGNEFTIFVGDILYLYLFDENGQMITDVTFTVEENPYISVDENGKITALDVKNAGVYVNIEYQGFVYKCLIRVYAQPDT